jgi:EAL domain-containing protein (putative c-di-GMP-specific phosphodiesterase class I)
MAEDEVEQDLAGMPPMPLHDSPQGRAVRTGTVVMSPDLQATLRGLPAVQAAVAHPDRPRSSLAVPMVARGKVIGVFELQSRQPDAYGQRDVMVARLVAAMAALALENLGVPVSARRARERRTTRTRLRGVIAERAFTPVYQPIVELVTGERVGYEALTRFAHGAGPETVFADAWEVGLGMELEAATLAAALGGSAALPLGAWLELNVSPQLVIAEEPLSSVIGSADRQLILEVTEHAPIADYGRFREVLADLPGQPGLAIDDAGAGHASLRHILEVRPQLVKLDRHLVHGLDHDLSRQALVAGMRHFADATGCGLVAEGIETMAERVSLQELGVRYGQGHLLGWPSPAEAWSEA